MGRHQSALSSNAVLSALRWAVHDAACVNDKQATGRCCRWSRSGPLTNQLISVMASQEVPGTKRTLEVAARGLGVKFSREINRQDSMYITVQTAGGYATTLASAKVVCVLEPGRLSEHRECKGIGTVSVQIYPHLLPNHHDAA